MDNLTTAVAATIASDRDMSEWAYAIAEDREPNRSTAEYVGNSIKLNIGERLSRRFDGAVPSDGVHDCLWMTFMGSVDWTEVGRYFLDD